ncbi:MAG: T9SS type A sorting domain-containing protein [Flavobacteriales bacterium]|nr:T9SS type A sorting domain-containing protein [Flavobacteriales bacterium]
MRGLENTTSMRKSAIIILSALIASISAHAQNWRDLVNDPNATFQETQEAFYAEFGDEVGEKGSGWKQFKRWEWFMEQRLDEHGNKPNQRLIFEEVKRANLQQEFRSGNSDWQLIGPIDEPQNDNGRSIGRISAIAFHPTDTNQMWVGAPSGGIWKSDDNGQSWSPLADDLPNLGVSDIVIHPHHPDTIYMSTGDGSSGDTYTYGVLKSIDGGQTWDTTGLSFGVSEAKNIRRLLLDTVNPNVLIAAGTSGIYRTEDAGITWNQVLQGNFCDMEFKPFSHDTVYASRGNFSSNPFFVSYDNGQTWNASTTGLNSSAITRMKIAVSPADPDVIYAVTCKSNSGLEGVYRSNNAGGSWALRTNINTPNLMSGDEYGAEEGGQGWYSMDIALSPENVNHIKVGGINVWESENGGFTFLLDAHWYGANGTYIHADQHRLMYHPITHQFYAGNDGGLYRYSYYFPGYESISTEMSITQFYRLSNAQSDPTLLLGGSQDNGTFRWRDNNWLQVYGGDGMEPMIDPEDSNYMFCATQRGGLHRSSDGGNTFVTNLEPAEGAWVTPFMLEPGNAEVVYSPSGSRVYRSDDRGSSWFEVSSNLTTLSSGPLVTFDVSHTNVDQLLAGTRTTLKLTTDLGGTWSEISGGLPNLSMTYVAFDPLEENTIWVTFSGYSNGNKVFRSLDAGETWQNMSMNLPNLPVNCIEIERSSAGGVYVGTDVGVYYWDRTLTEWEPFMTGLPNVIVNELEIHEDAQMIRAATYGRGMWESNTRNFINVGIQDQPQKEETQVQIWPNPTSDELNIEFEQVGNDINILDAYGRIVLLSVNPQKKKMLNIDIRTLATGVYYLRSDAGNLIGRFIVQ